MRLDKILAKKDLEVSNTSRIISNLGTIYTY